jgi:quercetin dioxygenase-like cupin family protein
LSSLRNPKDKGPATIMTPQHGTLSRHFQSEATSERGDLAHEQAAQMISRKICGGAPLGIRTVLLVPILFVAALVVAQSGRQRTSRSDLPVQESVIRSGQQNTFNTSSVLPDWYTYAVERGNPEAGPSVTYSKLAAGCKVPWHTHSANAQVLFVSGAFQLHMKGRQQVQILSQGSYAYVPANHQHQETCLDGCT